MRTYRGADLTTDEHPQESPRACSAVARWYGEQTDVCRLRADHKTMRRYRRADARDGNQGSQGGALTAIPIALHAG